MPRLVILYIRHVLIGFAIAAVFVALLIWRDVGHLNHLILHTESGPLAAGLLWFFNGIVFSGVQFGIAIMRLARPNSGGGGGRRQRPMPGLQPVRVKGGSGGTTRTTVG